MDNGWRFEAEGNYKVISVKFNESDEVLLFCSVAVRRTKDQGERTKFGGQMKPTRYPTLEMICLLDEVFP